MTTITLATPSLDPGVGGPAYSVSSIGKNLTARGIETIYTVAQGGRFVPRGSVRSLLQPFRADLVHNFGVWTALNHWASWTSRIAGRPMIFCPMGMLEPWSLAHHSFRKRVGMQLYQRRDLEAADALHATSQAEANNLRDLGFKAPISLIPHGVEIPEGVSPPFPRASGQPRTVLFLSRLHKKKGLLDLIEAWALLRPTAWRVVIAGPDKNGHRRQLERAIDRHRLRDQFSFVGAAFGDEKRRLFLSADLMVLPTYSENFGLVVPEALAHGLPVLTTTGAPWAELVETDSGFWIEPGIESLVEGLRTALAVDSERLQAMGARGRKLVSERYGWAAIMEKHLAMYRWTLHGGPRPSFVMT